jgi:hypothetical protein
MWLSYGRFGASPRDEASPGAAGAGGWRRIGVADRIEAAVVLAAFAGFTAINGFLVVQAAVSIDDDRAAPVAYAASERTPVQR